MVFVLMLTVYEDVFDLRGGKILHDAAAHGHTSLLDHIIQDEFSLAADVRDDLDGFGPRQPVGQRNSDRLDLLAAFLYAALDLRTDQFVGSKPADHL